MSRAEMKARGKAAFKRNYWKCVIVSFILGLLVTGSVGATGPTDVFTIKDDINTIQNGGFDDYEGDTWDGDIDEDFTMDPVEELEGIIESLPIPHTTAAGMALIGIIATVFLGILAVISILDILVFSVFEVGGATFFIHNMYRPAEIGEILSGFKGGHYGNIVLTQLLRKLFVFLWSLLFIIPGIVKEYSYSMVPYILAENGDLPHTEAITLSRQMMNGHKMELFILELSFIGWNILSLFTFGLLGIFYVDPYMNATRAEFYRSLRGGF